MLINNYCPNVKMKNIIEFVIHNGYNVRSTIQTKLCKFHRVYVLHSVKPQDQLQLLTLADSSNQLCAEGKVKKDLKNSSHSLPIKSN